MSWYSPCESSQLILYCIEWLLRVWWDLDSGTRRWSTTRCRFLAVNRCWRCSMRYQPQWHPIPDGLHRWGGSNLCYSGECPASILKIHGPSFYLSLKTLQYWSNLFQGNSVVGADCALVADYAASIVGSCSNGQTAQGQICDAAGFCIIVAAC